MSTDEMFLLQRCSIVHCLQYRADVELATESVAVLSVCSSVVVLSLIPGESEAVGSGFWVKES